MDVANLKRSQLKDVARHRDELRRDPHLRWLFFEITNRCNLKCRHCGSSCSLEGLELTADEVKSVLDTLGIVRPMICLTGGEPLLHPSFFEIAEAVHSKSLSWGMTTNATLIDEDCADMLKRTGMGTVSVSLDGMEESHDLLRQQKGAWKRAVRGIEALQRAGFSPQVTTVFHKRNFAEFDTIYGFLCDLGISSWRPINVEPIGRACESGDMLLDADQFACLIKKIKEKRFDRAGRMEVTFGCSHYLGIKQERMVRDHYFLCGAGILTASIRSNGDICACLDIENRPELVQGNIRTDDFMDVWINRFKCFRSDRTEESSTCLECPERYICGGDSTHTWNFDKKEPLLCYRDYGGMLENVGEVR